MSAQIPRRFSYLFSVFQLTRQDEKIPYIR